MPENDLAALVPKRGQIGVGCAQKLVGGSDVAMPIREVVTGAIEAGIVEDEILVHLGPERLVEVRVSGSGIIESSGDPHVPSAPVVLSAEGEPGMHPLACDLRASVDRLGPVELWRCKAARLGADIALFVAAFALVTGKELHVPLTASYLVSLLYLSLFGTALAFGAYLSLLGRIGADKAAYASVLFPLVALGLSTWLEGFVWHGSTVLGLCLSFVGNVIILSKRRA